MSEIPLPDDIEALVERAIAEDLGDGDRTAQLVPDKTTQASFVAREPFVLCGTAWAEAVCRQIDPAIELEWRFADGASVKSGDTICRLSGPARGMLSAERTALNFLQTLSGTATVVRRFVERVRGTDAEIVDTRKTIPGLRSAQKYAVRCGGGTNHRAGLYDAILIKENHIAAAGGIEDAIAAARALNAGVPVMCEAENLNEVQAALDGAVDLLLCDDFPTHLLTKAVAMTREYRRFNRAQTIIEASGGISINNVRDIADTGVDRISIGGLTKNLQAVDISMRVDDASASDSPGPVHSLSVKMR